MASQIIQFTHEIELSGIVSYLSSDFSNEIQKINCCNCDYSIEQMNQSSVYTENGKVLITTRMLIDFAECRLRKSA